MTTKRKMTTIATTRTSNSGRVAQAYVRTPAKEVQQGVRTFYLPASDGVTEYTVKHSWVYSGTKSWACSCPDFFHRHAVAGGTCRHIKTLQRFIAAVGGLRKIPRGVTIGNRQEIEHG